MTGPRSPILVTGLHRSGTTWVGRMLALASDAHYVHEPFAPMNHRAWLSTLPTIRYEYRSPEREWPAGQDLHRIADLRPNWVAIARRSQNARDVARLLQDVAMTTADRVRGARAVIKDPFALLSAEWIAEQTGAPVVVTVRHPAAFVSSIQRLNWRFDESWLLRQPDLMDRFLSDFEEELSAASTLDLLEHSCLVWRALTAIIGQLHRENPAWTVRRYEDFAVDPVERFRELYGRCGLTWSDRTQQRIAMANSAHQGTEVAPGEKGGTRRDSKKAIWTWRERLSAEQIALVRRATADVHREWYADASWWVPTNDR